MKEKSCGIIIVKDNKVLMVKQKNDIYSFPKGHVEGNETEKETAIRETKEETNIDAEIISDEKYKVFYKTKKGKDKEVVYFIGKPKNDNLKPQEGEIDEVSWVDKEKVENFLQYENIREMWLEVKNKSDIN